MVDNNFFKRRTPLERLADEKKAKAETKSASKENYDKNSRNREYTSLAQLYPKNNVSASSILLELKRERTKSRVESFNIKCVEDVMICVPCREKYYSDNKISADKYIPTKSDFSKNPYVFGSVSFRTTTVEKHSADSNAFHGLAVTRKENLSREEEEGSQSDARKMLVSINEAQRNRLKILFINTYVKRKALLRIRTLHVTMDQVKVLDIGTTYLNRKMVMEFSVAIAQCEMTKLRVLFNKSKFFSLVLDEATYVYRLEQCIAYVRFSVRGEIFTKFLSIDSAVRSKAKQITDCIISMMEKTLLWSPPDLENVVSDDMFERSGESETILEMELEGETNIDDESAVLTDFEDDVGSLTTPARGSEQDDNNFNGELKVQDEIAWYEEVSVSLENNEEKHLNSNHPLLGSITTDGANVLRGKRSGVSARLRSLCNKLLLHSHCVSHRCQLELKKTAEKGMRVM